MTDLQVIVVNDELYNEEVALTKLLLTFLYGRPTHLDMSRE